MQVKDQKLQNDLAEQTTILNATPEFWKNMKSYGLERNLLSEKDLALINIASSIHITGKLPSNSECDALLQTYERMKEEGYPDDIAPQS